MILSGGQKGEYFSKWRNQRHINKRTEHMDRITNSMGFLDYGVKPGKGLQARWVGAGHWASSPTMLSC